MIQRAEFTMLRGSVPLCWLRDDPFKSGKLIFLMPMMQKMILHFRTHMEKLQKGYVVDLMGQKNMKQCYKEHLHCNQYRLYPFNLNKYAENIEQTKSVFYSQQREFMTDQKNNIADGRGPKYHRIEYIYKSIWFVPNIDKNNTDPETDNY